MNIFLRFPVLLLLALSVLLAACSGTLVTEEPTQISEPDNTSQEASEPLQVNATIYSDEEAREKMYQLLVFESVEVSSVDELIQEIATSGDTRFVPVFIEMMRGAQIGIVPSGQYPLYINALETLSGEGFDQDWPAWVEWYGNTDIEPPPGYTGWKGQLLGRIDQGFAAFLRDDFESNIRVEEIQWGGVRVDGIPALDQAPVVTPSEADYLLPEEPVFGIAINGEARAYPLRILDWHEMANDIVGGVPVSLAYCTLCGAGIAFDGRASDGETYDFGSSGFLFRSNKLMYDRQTRTLWNQLTGEPVLGPLVGSGVQLDLQPVVLASWAEWLAQHPETTVLDIDTGHNRFYELGAAYGDYFASSRTMFPVPNRSESLEDKSRIYALRIDGEPKAYPLDVLAEEQVVNDSLGGLDIVLVATRGTVEVDGANITDYISVQGGTYETQDVTYNAGGEVRVYERSELTFEAGPDADTVLDSDGNQWQVTEEALIGPDGQSLPRVNGHLAYWFGWFSFFPNTAVYGQE
ncbi:MAG: DUF3179 domain-containing protein [Chloroflexi bacterium]|nr:MAG: DUF3179 domain-containing protein [Chloroflexota bacterium]MBL1195387.1 DUF3179 domain-containing protein [Chloroflexota bacterium]NOH12670.1 DUF3179 domain-containing protein [Chloroflexota bacterium]